MWIFYLFVYLCHFIYQVLQSGKEGLVNKSKTLNNCRTRSSDRAEQIVKQVFQTGKQGETVAERENRMGRGQHLDCETGETAFL